MTTTTGHNGKRPLPPIDAKTLRRFLEKISIPPGPNGRFECWEYNGSHNAKTGRPTFWLNGKSVLAYRVAWKIWRGTDDTSGVLDHLCQDNPGCVNPDHLRLTTQEVNVLTDPNTVAGMNARKTHCIRGHEYTEENTRILIRANGKTFRNCKTCLPNRKGSAKRGTK